jgi:uncharacterized protein (TIGR03435 family)
MMQSLLADRFKLAAHIETRQGPVFALELAKSGQAGPELHLRSPDAKPCGKFTLSASARTADGSPDACDVFLTLVDIGHVHTSARNVTIGMIAGAMPFPGMEPLNRPVVDRTGLTGNFDFSIDYAPEDTASPSAPSSESQPTFLQALQSQLGLRLTSTTGPVTTLVIDHIEEPTPN